MTLSSSPEETDYTPLSQRETESGKNLASTEEPTSAGAMSMTHKVSHTEETIPQNPLDERQVLDYLLRHPEFIKRHGESLQGWKGFENLEDDEQFPKQGIPERQMGHNVSDLQAAMVRYLRVELAQAERAHRDLQRTARDNLQDFRRAFSVVIELIRSPSLDDMINYVQQTLPKAFGIEAAVLCMEVSHTQPIPLSGIRPLPTGFVDDLFEHQRVILREDIFGDGHVFGAQAPIINSDALLRLDMGENIPPAILAFGSTRANSFSEDQATDVIEFLTQAIGYLICLWRASYKTSRDESQAA